MAKKYHHISRKELKQDAVHDAGQSALEYLDLHRTKILTALLSVTALVLVLTLSARVVRSNRLAASKDLSVLQKQYVRAQMQSDAAMRTELLKPLLKACENFASENVGSYFGNEALYLKGNCLYLQGDYEEAASAFQNYLDGVKTAEDKAKGNIALGYVYENRFFENRDDKSLLEKALAAYEAGAKTDPGSSAGEVYYSAEAMMNIARLNEETGKYEEAKTLYEKIVGLRAFDDAKNDDEEEDDAQLSQQEVRAKMFREDLRSSMRQFTFKEIAERRLKLIEARQ